MSVYGDFLENFPEAFRTIELLDGRKIRGIYISHGGDMVRLSYEKYESDGLMRDIVDQDELYVLRRTSDMVKDGTEFFHPDNGCVMRIVVIVTIITWLDSHTLGVNELQGRPACIRKSCL